ncbi:hypothetical protein EBV26_16310 [bacterium]|jgi:hypothetical protein|nr:hypothetical protein [bacterium]
MSHLEFDMNMLLNMLNEGTDKKIIPEPEKAEAAKEPIKPIEAVKPKRCQHDGCKVKLTLADFACRCKSFYCSQHRFAELHKCTFDYKTIGKEVLAKQMVEVKGNKLDRV